MFMNRYVTPRDMGMETHLSDADIDRVLKENDTGVLALARENTHMQHRYHMDTIR